MRTTSKDKISKAEALLAIVEQRKELERKEAELKAYFKDELSNGVIEAGNVIIIIEQCTRTTIDRAKLELKIGAEMLKEFEKTTEYSQLKVQRKLA